MILSEIVKEISGISQKVQHIENASVYPRIIRLYLTPLCLDKSNEVRNQSADSVWSIEDSYLSTYLPLKMSPATIIIFALSISMAASNAPPQPKPSQEDGLDPERGLVAYAYYKVTK